jgi:hypothetical protein
VEGVVGHMNLKKGVVLRVYEPFWAKVLNPTGVNNRSGHIYYKEKVVIDHKIQVEKVDYKKDRVLFVVRTPYADKTSAPEGTLIIEKISEFVPRYEKAKKEYEAQEQEEKEIQDWIAEK